MKDETLLPCPFCGGEPEEEGGTFIEYRGHERQDYSITCKQCGAEVHCEVGDFEGADAVCSCHHNTRKICSAKWNRRAIQSGNSAQPVTVPDELIHHDKDPEVTKAYKIGFNACLAVVKSATVTVPAGYVLVPVEPTETMIVNGFESEPDEHFSASDVWEAYQAMSGCQQAAHRAKLCWAAMLAAAPKVTQ